MSSTRKREGNSSASLQCTADVQHHIEHFWHQVMLLILLNSRTNFHFLICSIITILSTGAKSNAKEHELKSLKSMKRQDWRWFHWQWSIDRVCLVKLVFGEFEINLHTNESVNRCADLLRFDLLFQWLGRGFCQMGHFQLFSTILKFSMGHFLSFYTDLYGPFSKLMGLWRTAPCLPNHCYLALHSQYATVHAMDRLGLVTHCWAFPCFSGKYRIHGKKIIPKSRPFPIFQMN